MTGAKSAVDLPDAAVALMDEVFAPPGAESSGPSEEAQELAARASVTVVLSSRKCAGWLTDWDVIH